MPDILSYDKTLLPHLQRTAAQVANGRSNAEIADLLGLTAGTVHEYINRILLATGSKNRTDIAVRVLRGELGGVTPE